MRVLGNKVAARNLAVARRRAGDAGHAAAAARTWTPCAAAGRRHRLPGDAQGELGRRRPRHARGRRARRSSRELLPVARREAKAAFGKDEVYLEKLVRRARHVEVQILGDSHGNLVHLFERDCTVQRRNQKVVERAPAVFLSEAQRARAVRRGAQRSGAPPRYRNAGTVEFLQDADTGKFYFIEVNPRIQVEHTVTECVTGIDIVKAQIRIAGGARIGDAGERRAAAGARSASTATPCSAASPPRIRKTTSSRTTARSPPTAARPASASASMPAPPTPAPSSRASTTRCW